MTPSGSGPGRPPCAGASQADVSTTTTAGLGTSSDVSLVGSSGRSWTVRLRTAHLLVAVRLGEWRDDAWRAFQPEPEAGGPTVPNDEARVGRRSHGALAVWRTLSAHPGRSPFGRRR